MLVITTRNEIRNRLSKCLLESDLDDLASFVKALHAEILVRKVKFPHLEFCGERLFESIPENKQVRLCILIDKLDTIGGNVITATILKLRLPKHFLESLEVSTRFIARSKDWYVTDIIGERVFGNAILTNPSRAIEYLKSLSQHPVNWVVRSIGPGVHFAIKRGANEEVVSEMFNLLLSLASATDYHIKTGIGWAAKTTAKFHPGIIEKYEKEIQNKDSVGQWFRGKVKIGLSRNQYAKGN